MRHPLILNPMASFLHARIPARVVMLVLTGCFAILFGMMFLPHDRRGSDRSHCIMNQRNLQQALRAHAKEHQLEVGDAIEWRQIVGFGHYIERVPECPVHGINGYTYLQTVPAPGVLVTTCKDSEHQPPDLEGW